jgi:hypothetical protein
VFLLNIPIAALGITAALAIIPESRGPASKSDVLGALLSTVGMTALVWGVISSAKDGWSSANTVGGLVVAVVFLTAFAATRWGSRRPPAMRVSRIRRGTRSSTRCPARRSSASSVGSRPRSWR